MSTINASQTSAQNIHLVLDAVLRAVQELKNGSGFGSIEIVVHEGRVTQIEKREKLRLQNSNPPPRK